MSNWHRTYKNGRQISFPPETGMYWITDGYYTEIGYWESVAGWAVDDGGRWVYADDWNFDVRYWKEISVSVIPKRLKERV